MSNTVLRSIYTHSQGWYTVKKVIDFAVPSWDVTNKKHLLAGKIYYFRPVIVWLVASRLGSGKSLTFFYSVWYSTGH